jgi:hypothetical protein
MSGRQTVSADISAENTFTDSIQLFGYFNLSISGTFSATVTVQRSYDNINFADADTFTSPSEEVGYEPQEMYYRVGIKTGDYTSGTASVSLSKDQVMKAKTAVLY